MLVPAKSTLGGSGSTTANALATTTTPVNVSNATAPSIGQILRATSSSTATWQSEDLLDLCKEGGAVGDANLTTGAGTDDTDAILAAVATGRPLYIPFGKWFKISTGFVLAVNQHMHGLSTTNSGLMYSAATGNCLTISAAVSANRLKGFTVAQDPTVTPTSGSGIYIGDSVNYVSNVVMEDVQAYRTYNGITFEGKNAYHRLTRCSGSSCVYANYYINCAVPYTFGWLINCTSYHSSAQGNSTVGLLMRQCDTANIFGWHGAGSAVGIWLKGDTGIISQIQILGVSHENCHFTSQYTLRIGDSTYSVRNVRITGLEIMPNSSGASAIYSGTKSEDNSIINGTIYSGYGLGTGLSDAGARNTFAKLRILGTQSVVLAGTYTRLRDCNMDGAFTTQSTANNLDVQGNYFPGTKSIHANSWAGSIIKDNRGLTDYATSVAATPFYIGQKAYVAGVIYEAAGTSSAADWKQVSN